MGMKLISDILLGVGGWRWLGFEVGGCGVKVGGGGLKVGGCGF